MSNISVTTTQNVIAVTDSGGITVTTPEGRTIDVTVPNSSVNVTNTTDDITILTSGTLIIQAPPGTITSVNGQTGPIVVLDTDDISEGTTNKYFSQTLARQSLSAGTGISYDNSTGVITNTSINTNTTYTIDATTATGGANFNLVGSDSSTDTIKIASGTNITVSRTDANTITIDGSDLNTTYAISSASTTGGANLTLTGSDSSTDSVAYKGSGATTVTSTDANTITIASTDTNTTYTQNASATSGGANLNLVGSDSTTDTIKFAEGTGITVVRTDADTITITNTVPDTNTTYTIASAATSGGANLTLTGSDASTDSVAYLGSGATTVTSTDANTVTISSTDTNTTYTQNISSTTGGANLNLVGSDSTTDTVKFADGTGVTVSYTDANTATIAIGQSVGTGDSPSFAGGTFGNITVGVATDNTIASTDTNGNIILDPNGTGDIVLTLADGGNLTNTRNYVLGAIRNSTVEAAGNMWGFLSGSGTGFRGISIDNSADTVKGPLQVIRGYTGGASAPGPTTPRLTFERARGTSAVPTAIQNGDLVGQIVATGANGTNTFIGDAVAAQPASMQFLAAENFSSTTNVGTQFTISLMPTGKTLAGVATPTTVFGTTPQATTQRSDSFTWQTGNTTALPGSTTIGSLVANDGSSKVAFTVSKSNATSATEYSLINFDTSRSSGGTYSPTQNVDVIGQFKFNGNALSGASSGGTSGPGVSITAAATETWTTTAQGTAVTFSANKIGAITQIAVINASPDALTFKSDLVTLQDSAAVNLVGGKIVYGRQYIEAYSTQDQTNPVANAENLMSFNNTGISNGISIVTNGTALTRITMANAGIFNLQFSAQLNQTTGGAHNAFIWLKKNGTAVANTAGDTRVAGNGDRIMAAWNYIVSAAAGDYYELAWAADDTAVLLDYVAAAGVVPAVPSVILTVVPVGA